MVSRTSSSTCHWSACCREVILMSLMLLTLATTSKSSPMPNNMVLPSGTWSEWGEWSPCTRSCGAGVTTQNRTCLSGDCTGASVQFQSCCIQDCPPVSLDFRAEQCQALNDAYSNWVPVKNDNDGCTLNCINETSQTQMTIAGLLLTFTVDGTSCKTGDGGKGVCLGKLCTSVGCDGVLGSDKIEDRCLQCHSPVDGPPHACQRFSGVSTPNGVAVSGNLPIVVIPSGAATITISHPLLPGEGTLGLKSSAGTYYYSHGMNGSLNNVGGAKFHLTIDYSGLHPREVLSTVGPITERITVELMNVHQSAPMVEYEYYVVEQEAKNGGMHNGNHSVDIEEPPTDGDGEFAWVYAEFSECSMTCGTGVQISQAECHDLRYPNRGAIHDNLCSETPKPFPLIQKCHQQECPPSWVTCDWSACSVSCGNGTQTRKVVCHQLQEEDYVPVSSQLCNSSSKPAARRECYRESCSTHWVAGEWSECPRQCGTWTQTRSVVCRDKQTGSEVDSSHCHTPRPPVSKDCVVPCEECYWSIRLGKCDNACGYGMQNRRIHCRHRSNDKKANESCCEGLPKPNRTQPCYDTRGTKCNPDWETYPYGECDCCGSMMKERRVVCAAVQQSTNTLVEFPDKECNVTTKPATTKSCEISECPRWQTSEWGRCSASCGDGIRNRTLSCVREDNGAEFPPEICACRELKPPVIQVCPGLAACPTTPPPMCTNLLPDITCESLIDGFDVDPCESEGSVANQFCCKTCRERFSS